MTDLNNLTERRTATPQGRAETFAWMERADMRLKEAASNPNEILASLLAAGCRVAFSQAGQVVTAEVTMPDGSMVAETGPNVVGGLVFAYGAGAWLADLPPLLADTCDTPVPERASAAAVPPLAPASATPGGGAP